MNSRCNDKPISYAGPEDDDDEASFDGLMAFDTVPPPPGGPEDVHSARTTVAELPDSFLDALKTGAKTEATARASGMTRAHAAFELPPEARVPYVEPPVPASDIAAAMAIALEAASPPVDSPLSPHHTPSSSRRIYSPPPVMAYPRSLAVERAETNGDRLRRSFLRGLVIATAAVLLASSITLFVWVLLHRYLM